MGRKRDLEVLQEDNHVKHPKVLKNVVERRGAGRKSPSGAG